MIVVGVFAAGIWLSGDQVEPAWLRFYSAAVFAATVAAAFWERYLWRWSPMQRIERVPSNIRGTWQGTLTSLWVDPLSGESPQGKTVYLVVRQTFSDASVVLLTDESRSGSTLAAVSMINGERTLDYVYINRPDPRVEHRSRMHHGSVVLDISGRPGSRLRGRYWTDRESRGELDFTRRHKMLADDFDSAARLFDGPPAESRTVQSGE